MGRITPSACSSGPRSPQGWTGTFPMFAYCQLCRKSPSPSTLVASFISSASFEEGGNKREKAPIASRSLPPPTGPKGQPHYTVVRSEVIEYKVERKRNANAKLSGAWGWLSEEEV